jgi:hypothetical protein
VIVQIYGVTTPDDAELVCALGADHVGVVLDEGVDTWDTVDAPTVRTIRRAVGDDAVVVALSLSTDPGRILQTVTETEPAVLHLARAVWGPATSSTPSPACDRRASTPRRAPAGTTTAAARTPTRCGCSSRWLVVASVPGAGRTGVQLGGDMVHTGRRTWTSLAAMALVAVTVVSCGDDDDDAGGTTTVPDASGGIQVEETEYAYVVTGTAPEGWVTVDVSNTGEEYHMMALGRMRDGVTLDQVRETMTEAIGGGGGGGGGEEQPPPEDGDAAGTVGDIQLVSAQEGEGEGEGEGEDPFSLLFEDEELGAPGHIMAPGESMEITTELEPGEYAIMCFLPTPDGSSDHISNGMINSFTVEASDEPAPMPEADTVIDISDESVDIPDELAGDDLFEVNLTGDHEFSFVRLLDEDATVEEVDQHFDRFDEEPLPTRTELEDGAPAVFDGFVFSTESGGHFFVRREMEPGTYFIGCGLDESAESETGEGRDHALTELVRVTVT